MSIRNPYTRLLNALPKYPKLLGTVVLVEDGSVMVELLGGGIVRATGTAALSDNVFVRNGLLESVAPAMPTGVTVLPNL